MVYIDDPLWDGRGCILSNPCCSFNNPPWFYKQLPQPTTDDLEMRVCRDEDVGNEDIVWKFMFSGTQTAVNIPLSQINLAASSCVIVFLTTS